MAELVAPRPPVSPWQRFYGAAHGLRRRWWASRTRELPVPVVSIGNLSWGGGGKTPFTAAVAAHLTAAGWRVAILSRGYGSRGRGVRFVSRGDGPVLLDSTQGGDEPVWLAGALPEVAVVVSPDRFAGGAAALAELDPAPQLFLLDDGFSHLALARDLDILLFPAADPFAGGRLPPAGRLREPLAAVSRADVVVLTGAVGPGDGNQLAAALSAHGYRGDGFVAPVTTAPPCDDTGQELPPGTPVLVVSAVARPEGFRAAVEAHGLRPVVELRFRDHHPYPPASLVRLRTAFAQSGAQWVVTTGKDRVKLAGRLDLPLAELPLTSHPEPKFLRWLNRQLPLPPERPG